MSGRRRRLTLLLASGVVLLLVAALSAYLLLPRGSELARAAALLPPDTERVTWTDWAGLRAELDAGDPEPGSAEADDFLSRAADRDLASASPTAALAADLAETLGWSPLRADWEILGQSPEGMVMVMRLPEGTDFGAIADHYEDAGFTPPDDDRTAGGLWRGGPDVVARLPGLNQPLLQHAALLEDERLLVTSDQDVFLDRAVPVASGDEDGLDLGRLAGPAEDALAAVGWATDRVCSDLAMSKADSGVRAQADVLVEDAGGVHPLTGYLVAHHGAGMTVVFGLEDGDQAEADAESRARLAGMEDPGQALYYPDLFRVEGAGADGDVAVLRLGDVAADSYPLTNLTQGPVLLASC